MEPCFAYGEDDNAPAGKCNRIRQRNGVARQQLAGLFQEIAPDNYKARQWGPLRRMPMRDNTYRWLCPEHAQEYR
jgi:hypothetical protein